MLDTRQPASVEEGARGNGTRHLWQAASSIFAQQSLSQPLTRLGTWELCPLSFAQERLWQLQQSEPGAPYYHVTLAWDIYGLLNVRALEASLDFLLQRHEVLRACFPDSASGPMQRIESWGLKLTQTDATASGLPAGQGRKEVLALAREFVRQPFDLAQGPLVRAALYRYGAQDQLLVFVVHQMLFDGASMRIFSGELAQCYRAFSQGVEPRLEPLALRYSDFAQWQRDGLQGEVLRSASEFWTGQLREPYEPLALPVDYARRNAGIIPGDQIELRLPASVTNPLKQLGLEQGITPFAALLASFQAFLGAWTGQDDVLSLVTIAGRNASALRKLVGLVANIVPMRLDLRGPVNWRQILARADHTVSSALAHQALPLGRILELMRLGSARPDVPALQVMVLYNNAPLPVLRLPDAVFTPSYELDNGTARFDLLLDVAAAQQGLVGHLKYRADLFKRETMNRLLEDWQDFIQRMVSAPNEPVVFCRNSTHSLGSVIPAPVPPLNSNANGAAESESGVRLHLPDTSSKNGTAAVPGARDQLEATLAQIWQTVFGHTAIGLHDNFFSLGGHSLVALKLIAAIEKETGRRLRLSTIFQEPTVARLAEALRHPDARESSSVVEIQPRGAQPPLFLVHGVGGGMFWGYSNLSRYLGPDQPVFGFKSRGLDGLDEFGSIGEMASHYVAELRRFRPQGPYYLGGYCFGGNVAYEMARQLTAQGQSVGFLFLMNCWPNNSSYTRISWTPVFICKALWNFCLRLKHQIQRGAQQPRGYFKYRTAWVRKRLKALYSKRVEDRLAVEDIVDLSPQPETERKLWSKHVQAWLQYQPQPYAGRIVLFRTRGHPLVCSFDHEMGWGSFAAGGVVVRICPGDHESILEEENAAETAHLLKLELDEARKQHSLVARKN